jgi:hypothetical protein
MSRPKIFRSLYWKIWFHSYDSCFVFGQIPYSNFTQEINYTVWGFHALPQSLKSDFEIIFQNLSLLPLSTFPSSFHPNKSVSRCCAIYALDMFLLQNERIDILLKILFCIMSNIKLHRIWPSSRNLKWILSIT